MQDRHTIIPEDIYCYFILDDALETARFLIAKNQAKEDALIIKNDLPTPSSINKETFGVRSVQR